MGTRPSRPRARTETDEELAVYWANRCRTWEARTATMRATHALLRRHGVSQMNADMLLWLNVELKRALPATPEAYLRHPRVKDCLEGFGVDVEGILRREAEAAKHTPSAPPPPPTQ